MSAVAVLGGRLFDLSNPRPEDVDFETVALVLARLPRFGGHTVRGALSVAQHLVEGARAIEREYRMITRDAYVRAWLLHDVHEYVIGDITTPVQDELGPEAAEALKRLKHRLDVAIHAAAGVMFPLPEKVREVVETMDLRMLRTERDNRVFDPASDNPRWSDAIESAVPVEGCDLSPWVSEMAFRELLYRFGYFGITS